MIGRRRGRGSTKRLASGRLGSALLAAALCALAAAGCDDESGPGVLSATLESAAPLGAATVEVVGSGIEGFEDLGDSRVFGSVISAEQGRYRVVVVGLTGAPLRFGVRVRNVAAELPALTVVAAAGTDNRMRPASGIQSRIER